MTGFLDRFRRQESEARIFGIGLPKTGTSSLHKALCNLGIRSVHYPINDVIPMLHQGEHDKIPSKYQALVNCGEWHFAALDRAYPGSKFIYTWREFDRWIASIEKHFSRYEIPQAGTVMQGNRLEVFSISVFDRDVMKTIYQAHRQAVESHFKDRQDLLRLNVEDPNAMKDLCAFLGYPVLHTSFPHENKAPK